MFLNCCANIINICTIIMMCLMLACDVRVGLPRTDANTIWYIVVGIQFLWVHSQYSLYFFTEVEMYVQCSSAVGHLQMSIVDFMLDDFGPGIHPTMKRKCSLGGVMQRLVIGQGKNQVFEGRLSSFSTAAVVYQCHCSLACVVLPDSITPPLFCDATLYGSYHSPIPYSGTLP